MKTVIISIPNNNHLVIKKLLLPCADALKMGSLVAFPTETVYGLGANALLEKSVVEVFSVKQRPSDNPLIVHIADVEQLDDIVRSIPSEAKKLIDTFWPGPLTLLLPKTNKIPDLVTCGMSNVAVRCPDHLIAREFLRASGVPVVAPSANLSGKPSPTKAEHVLADLNGKIPYVIDGGSCTIGIESTVLGFDGRGCPVIYRHGAITQQMIESLLGVALMNKTQTVSTEQPVAPGMKYRHYSPSIPVYIIEPDDLHTIEGLKNNTTRLCLLAYDSPEAMASLLFHDFREAERSGYTAIYVQSVPEVGLGKAVMERLRKAASG